LPWHASPSIGFTSVGVTSGPEEPPEPPESLKQQALDMTILIRSKTHFLPLNLNKNSNKNTKKILS